MLLVDYPTGKGKELEPYIPALNPNFSTREPLKAGVQMKKRDNEIRVSSHLYSHTGSLLTFK